MPSFELAFKSPLNWAGVAGFMASRGAIGVECLVDQAFWRTIRAGECKGWVRVARPAGADTLSVHYADDLGPVESVLKSKLRALFDLDAEPAVINRHLLKDGLLKDLLNSNPGVRVPGAVDGFELALRAVLGQQISVKAASTVYGRFASTFGERSGSAPIPELTHLPPTAEALAASDLVQVIRQGLTQRRAETVRRLAHAVAHEGLRLEPGVDPQEARRQLLELPGIGPWTASYIAMRALRDADALPEADLGLMKALGVKRPRDLLARAERWRPWRAYAAMLLWSAATGGG